MNLFEAAHLELGAKAPATTSPPALVRGAAALAVALTLSLAGCGGGYGSYGSSTPPPSITLAGASPSFCPTRGSATVTLAGIGFQAGATVSFGGVAGTAVLVRSATSLTVTCPAHPAGPTSLVVANGSGQSVTLDDAFTYRDAPVITAVTPPAGSPLGGALVTITGSGFFTSPQPAVAFGDAAAALVRSSDTSLTVTAPAHTAGTVAVSVTNGDGLADALAAAFTYQALAPPELARLSATAGFSAGGDPVTLTGSGFSPPMVVTFGSTQVPVTAHSTTSASVLSPPASPGSVTVTLTNSDGQVSNGLTFSYQDGAPPPSVASVSPASGSTKGGRTVSISGSHFSTNPVNPIVSFGGQAVPVLNASATQITVTTDGHEAGSVPVTVTNPDGQAATLAAAYAYLDPPVLLSLSPLTGSTGGGEQVDLTGISFDVSTPPVVTFGGTPAVVTPGSTATSMTALAPTHGPGGVDVTVINGDGQVSALAGGFTYRAPASGSPTVASVVNGATGRASGGSDGGEAVTIIGTGFAPGASVFFGSAAASAAFISTTTLTATTPLAQPPGTVDVTVSLPGGLAGTLARGFTFLLAAPRVTTLTVFGSPPAGGGLLLVKGVNLQANGTVTFGGVPATVTEFSPGVPPGGDVLTAIVPPSPLPPGEVEGFVSVVLENPDGQSSTLPPSVSPDGTPWPANFHYGPPPVVTGFAPTTGRSVDVTLTGTGFSADASGARSGLQVLLSGPTFAILPLRRCPNAAEPACLLRAAHARAWSVLVMSPARPASGAAPATSSAATAMDFRMERLVERDGMRDSWAVREGGVARAAASLVMGRREALQSEP